MLIASVYFINCCWHEIQSFCGSNHPWAHNHVDVYCALSSSKQGNFCVKIIYEAIITLMPVAWWRHQNEKISFSLILILFVTWQTLNDLNFRSFCERSHLWTYGNANIDDVHYHNKKIYFCWSVNFFFGSNKLFMTEIKSERAYNHVGTLYAMT